jgi:beta-mannosidase
MLCCGLNGKWELNMAGEDRMIPARVPGSGYLDLLEAGLMEDPFYRDNEDRALKLMENDFTYSRAFDATAELLGCDRILLRMEGVDTLADIYVNGTLLLRADNMHRTWEVDVKGLLHTGTNGISVRFRSPTRFIRQAYAENPGYTGSDEAMRGFVHLRKAHCMFGWDWGPRLPDCGIWRNICLLGIAGGRLGSVQVRQAHQDGKVTLTVDTRAEMTNDAAYSVTAEAISPDGKVYIADEQGNIVIGDPRLWWPAGYGGQPLYTVRAWLNDQQGNLLDTWEKRIGLRTMTVRIRPDEWGQSFCHEVNGVSIFAMGADYIPEDSLIARMTPERTHKLLHIAREANFNAIRVWGGGHYPSDAFYDLCDEMGLVIWQDCMFACGAYKLTDAFEANIRAEIRDNVLRLRHHASLGLWCGNNEMEMFAAQNHWVITPWQHAEYLRMYEQIIPGIISALDPDTFYWPASPSSGGGFDDPNTENRGDVHYWDVWHGGKPFTDYRKFHFRYASEFGFQAYPAMQTLEAVTLPGDRNAFSKIMEKHQRNAGANGRIMASIASMYLYPKDFPSFIYASQMLQADAIRYGVEHWRRHRGRCMGAIYWQLNDCWPVISWSSADYFLRRKALHYAARRFFAPLMISCREEGELTGMEDVNTELAQPVRNIVQLCVCNETQADARCAVTWYLRDALSRVIAGGTHDITAPALSSVWLDEMEFPDMDRAREYFSYELTYGGDIVSRGAVLLTRPKHFSFQNPHLRARLEGNEVVVTAAAFTRGVALSSADGSLALSDNWFDMDAGERRVRILEGDPAGLTARSVYDIA